MGVTYKASIRPASRVAPKVTHPRDLADATSWARFLSEAAPPPKPRHRNISAVLHLGSKREEDT